MPENMASDSLFVPTFIARQPIFDTKQKIWGYELLYRHSSDATAAIFSDEESATIAVAACASCQGMSFTNKSKLLINFSEKSVIDKVPQALPAENTVVEIAEASPTESGYLECLQQLKREGYTIAIDGYEGKDGCEDIYNLADIFIIDILGKSVADMNRLVQKTNTKSPLLIAKRIEDHEKYQTAQKLGFPLFQGFFFRKPEMMVGRKLSASQISRLNLFALMEQEEPDFDKLTTTIQSDVGISYNLLSYLNSPAIGLREKITSIRQALLLLGWKQIKNWLRVAVLRDMTPSDKTSEIPYMSVQRGKFFQLAAQNGDAERISPDSLFLLGLFSLLDTMLSLPMKKIVANLPLEEAFKAALCGESNHFSRWLELAICFETADWDNLNRIITEMHLDPMNVAQAYYESIAWASMFFQQQEKSEAK